jgi:hypothetical protein
MIEAQKGCLLPLAIHLHNAEGNENFRSKYCDRKKKKKKKKEGGTAREVRVKR